MKKRFLPYLLCGLFISSVLFVFTPLDFYKRNSADLNIPFENFFTGTLVVFLAVFVLIEIFFFLLYKMFPKAARAILVLAFAIGFMFYLQGNYLSIGNGVLTGATPDWASLRPGMIRNLLVWILIIASVVVFCLKKKARAEKTVTIVSSVLILAMLSVAVVTYGLSGNDDHYAPLESDGYVYPTVLNEFTFSENGDIVIFTLDTLDARIFERVLQEHPEKIGYLKDFTYYRNTSGTYCKTDPSFVSMLTGAMYYNEKPFFLYSKEAFESSGYFDFLKQNGYSINAYGTPLYAVPASMESEIDNISVMKPGIYFPRVFASTLVRFVGYKCAPKILQPVFYFDFAAWFRYAGNSSMLAENWAPQDDFRLLSEFSNRGITVDNTGKFFKYYLMTGAHTPYTIDSDAAYVGEGNTNEYEQVLGTFTIIGKIISGMQRTGVYGHSTVIITADHGDTSLNDDSLPDGNLSVPLLLVKVPQAENDAITVSDVQASLLDIRATTVDILGGDYSAFGTSLLSLSEDAPDRERLFYTYHWVDPQGSDFYLQPITEYRVPSHAGALGSYSATGNIFSHDD